VVGEDDPVIADREHPGEDMDGSYGSMVEFVASYHY